MPLVIVTVQPGLLSPQAEKGLGEFLQETVSRFLDVPDDPEARLTPGDIEVRFQDVSPRTINPSPLSIEIVANTFRKRAADLDERVHKIAGHLRICKWVPQSVIDGKGGFVRCQLAQGVFERL